MCAGPGMPVVAVRYAMPKTSGMRSGRVTCVLIFDKGFMAATWSSTCMPPRGGLMRSVRREEVRAIMGMFSANAVATPAIMFATPGPAPEITTPGFPVTRAIASAM